jgi:hypothetical protein
LKEALGVIPYHSEFWEQPEHVCSHQVESWLDSPGLGRRQKIKEAYRERGKRDWVRMHIEKWKLDQQDRSVLAFETGLSGPQVCRFINYASISLESLLQLVAKRTLPMHPPSLLRLSVHGFFAAMAETHWLASNRPNRTKLSTDSEPQLDRAVLIAAVLAAGHLFSDWHNLTSRYRKELEAVPNDPAVVKFMASFKAQLVLFAEHDPVCRARHAQWCPLGSAAAAAEWELFCAINTAWSQFDVNAIRCWTAVADMTPWDC